MYQCVVSIFVCLHIYICVCDGYLCPFVVGARFKKVSGIYFVVLTVDGGWLWGQLVDGSIPQCDNKLPMFCHVGFLVMQIITSATINGITCHFHQLHVNKIFVKHYTLMACMKI